MVPKSESVPDVDVNIVDGDALLHILDPKKSHKSLSKLSMTIRSSCSCHIERMLQDVVKIDVVWDTYMKDRHKHE